MFPCVGGIVVRQTNRTMPKIRTDCHFLITVYFQKCFRRRTRTVVNLVLCRVTPYVEGNVMSTGMTASNDV